MSSITSKFPKILDFGQNQRKSSKSTKRTKKTFRQLAARHFRGGWARVRPEELFIGQGQALRIEQNRAESSRAPQENRAGPGRRGENRAAATQNRGESRDPPKAPQRPPKCPPQRSPRPPRVSQSRFRRKLQAISRNHLSFRFSKNSSKIYDFLSTLDIFQQMLHAEPCRGLRVCEAGNQWLVNLFYFSLSRPSPHSTPATQTGDLTCKAASLPLS